jgi:hypothetical protein
MTRRVPRSAFPASHANAPLSVEGRRRLVERMETWRREHKWSAQRITDELADSGFKVNRRTVTRHGQGRRPQVAGRAQSARTGREYTYLHSAIDGFSRLSSTGNVHYNYHRPHSGAGGQPPASRLREGVTNVQPSYTQHTQQCHSDALASS